MPQPPRAPPPAAQAPASQEHAFPEVVRVDPAALLQQQRQQQPGLPTPPMPRLRRSSEQELLDRLEPMPLPKPKTPPPEPPKPVVHDARAKPVRPPDPITTLVSNDLIAALEKDFGYEPAKLYDVELGPKKLKVSLRVPSYDDYIWALAFLERKLQASEDLGLLQTETQRTQMLSHVLSCRCVQRIRDNWVWELFGVTEAQIRMAKPDWDGTPGGLPDFYHGVLATKVYELFRTKMHPDIMFALDREVKRIDAEQQEAAAEAQAGDAEAAPDAEDPVPPSDAP